MRIKPMMYRVFLTQETNKFNIRIGEISSRDMKTLPGSLESLKEQIEKTKTLHSIEAAEKKSEEVIYEASKKKAEEFAEEYSKLTGNKYIFIDMTQRGSIIKAKTLGTLVDNIILG